MRLFFGWTTFIIIVLISIYCINNNLEKSIEVRDFIKIKNTKNATIYSVKDSLNENKLYDLRISKNSEIYFVSGTKKTLNLKIDRPNKNIILILTSKEKTIFNIENLNNTKIDLILYNKKSIEIKSKEKVFKYDCDLSYVDNVKNLNFLKSFAFLYKLIPLKKINDFYLQDNSKEILINEKLNKINTLFLDDISFLNDIEFELISKDKEFVKFNLFGSKDKKLKNIQIAQDITYNGNKTHLYEIYKNGLKIINFKTKEEEIKKIPVIRVLRYPRGIAYDTNAKQVFIADKLGKFYVFDARKEKWISIRKYIDDFEINSLVFDSILNIFLSSSWKKEELITFDFEGNFLNKIDLTNRLRGLEYYYNKNEQTVPQIQIIPKQMGYILILINEHVEMIWYLDKLTNKTYLTYNYYLSN